MTQSINFFPSFAIFRSFSSIGTDRRELKLANGLKKDGQRLCAEGEAEFSYGNTAQTLAMSEKADFAVKNLCEIAVWHFQRSADLYRRSAARFEEASRLQTAKQKDFSDRAKQLFEYVGQIELKIDSLSEILSQS